MRRLFAALFAATAALPAAAAEREPVLLQADRMSYDQRSRVVTAEGAVEISTGTQTLTAPVVIYDQASGTVTAKGGVTIVSADGDVARADQMTLKDDLRDGVIDNITLVIGEQNRMAAARATRSGGAVTTLDRAVYTACLLCPGDTAPLWQIKAVRVVRDETQQEITYDDATLELFGQPVLYLPYFRHPDPTVDRKSGFLAPDFGSSSAIGAFAEIPYYWAPAPDYDITVAPLITTGGGIVLKGEYRRRFDNGGFDLAGSVAYTVPENTGNPDEADEGIASHLFGTGRFKLEDGWRWGFDAAIVSDDTYLERYDISTEDRFTSRLYAERFWQRHYFAINSYYFQSLRAGDVQARTPLALPLAEMILLPDEKILGGQLRIDANVLALHRDEGQNTRRLSLATSWQRGFVSRNGQLFRAIAEVRGDAYQVESAAGLPFASNGAQTTTRVLGLAALDWRWPWFTSYPSGERVVIEPIVQAIVAPYGGNPADIPNEDSASFEFDDTNLFSLQKFPGLDRWESGPRINAGVRLASYLSNGGIVEVLAGQNFRLKEDRAFARLSGLGDQESDIVGRLVYAPNADVRFVQKFRLDPEDGSVPRNEIFVDLSKDWGDLRLTYLRLAADAAGLGLPSREEVSADGRLSLFDTNWSLYAGARRDLESDRMLESRFGVGYEDECSALSLVIRRRFFEDRDIRPSTAVILRLDIKTGGGFEPVNAREW